MKTVSIQELQQVVKRTINEEKASDALKSEIKRVLGPSVVTEGKLETVVASANDWMDVLDRTGRSSRLAFKPAVTACWLDHSSAEVRSFAARVVPEHFLSKMTTDRSPQVRAQVAARISLPVVREMMKRFPSDDQIRSIYRTRKIDEAGIPQPKVVDEPFDMYGEKRMGAVSKTNNEAELSDEYYATLAQKLMRQFGSNLEYSWEEIAVDRYVKSVKASTGVEIDAEKLIKCIKELIKEKEDLAMEKDALKETMSWLKRQNAAEMLKEGMLPDIVEEVDPVLELVHSNLTSEQYVEQASRLFRVQESMLPLGIRKYRLGEGNARQTKVPCIGMLPHGGGFSATDERALDMFCSHWTARQAIAGEPLKLEWTNHPSDMNKIGFTVLLK